MAKQNINSKQGFTIIEVVLVLAIAGLIFLMVFIALPALQRSQRDTQRRDDMARVATALNQYQANNGGKLPDDTNTAFIANYMGSDFTDPGGTDYKISFVTGLGDKNGGALNEADATKTTIAVYKGAVCSDEKAVAAKNARDYAIVYKLEGSGVYCADSGGTATTPSGSQQQQQNNP